MCITMEGVNIIYKMTFKSLERTYQQNKTRRVHIKINCGFSKPEIINWSWSACQDTSTAGVTKQLRLRYFTRTVIFIYLCGLSQGHLQRLSQPRPSIDLTSRTLSHRFCNKTSKIEVKSRPVKYRQFADSLTFNCFFLSFFFYDISYVSPSEEGQILFTEFDAIAGIIS